MKTFIMEMIFELIYTITFQYDCGITWKAVNGTLIQDLLYLNDSLILIDLQKLVNTIISCIY